MLSELHQLNDGFVNKSSLRKIFCSSETKKKPSGICSLTASFYLPLPKGVSSDPKVFRDALRMKQSGDYFFSHLQAILQGLSCLKKSLPLSSTRMKAGKFSTVIL